MVSVEDRESFLRDLDWNGLKSCVEETTHLPPPDTEFTRGTNVLLTTETNIHPTVPAYRTRFFTELGWKAVMELVANNPLKHGISLPTESFWPFDEVWQDSFDDPTLPTVNITVTLKGSETAVVATVKFSTLSKEIQ
jgi:hypothetical protein